MPNVFPLLIGNLSERYLSIKCDPNSIDEIWRCIDPSQLTCIESTSDSEFGEATGLPFLNDREKIFYSLITVHSVVEVQEVVYSFDSIDQLTDL